MNPKYFKSPNTLPEAVQEQDRQIMALAELLHLWHCHKHGGPDESCPSDPCTWQCEPWHRADPYTSEAGWEKPLYVAKAGKVWGFLKTAEECKKVLYFLQMVNPKLAWKLIEEL